VFIRVHLWFKKVFLEERRQTMPVFIEFLYKTKPNRTQSEPKNPGERGCVADQPQQRQTTKTLKICSLKISILGTTPARA
jgi:hypothetical protein